MPVVGTFDAGPDGGSPGSPDGGSPGDGGLPGDGSLDAMETLGPACTSSATCGGGECVFRTDGGCSVQGVCFHYAPPPGVSECAHSLSMCACDGTQTVAPDCELPGYALAPVSSPTAFTCPSDAGVPIDASDPLGGPCATSATCGTGGACIFPTNGGCSAQGVCFYADRLTGAHCDHAIEMCACNGASTVAPDCEIEGYAYAPVPSPTSYICPSDAGTGGG